MTSVKDNSRRLRGFTLVELLVVIGIIALLISILLPSLNAARKSARDVQCASNMRQLSLALMMYAVEHKGSFPPNMNFGAGVPGYAYWYDADRLESYLPAAIKYGSGSIGGPVFECPDDPQAARSYSMNVFASAKVSTDFEKVLPNGTLPIHGQLWGTNTGQSSDLLLVGEQYSAFGTEGAYAADATVGVPGTTSAVATAAQSPGVRWGGNGGLPPATLGRFENARGEMDYTRHRRDDVEEQLAPEGRMNIAFADGHVDMVRSGELYIDDEGADDDGQSTFRALWSPLDREIELEMSGGTAGG